MMSTKQEKGKGNLNKVNNWQLQALAERLADMKT